MQSEFSGKSTRHTASNDLAVLPFILLRWFPREPELVPVLPSAAINSNE